jgi:hypothetical protein
MPHKNDGDEGHAERTSQYRVHKDARGRCGGPYQSSVSQYTQIVLTKAQTRCAHLVLHTIMIYTRRDCERFIDVAQNKVRCVDQGKSRQ